MRVQCHFCHCLSIWSISVLQMRGPSSSFTWAPFSLGGARARGWGRFSHFEVSKCTEPVFPVSFQINGHHQTGGETACACPSHAAPATGTPKTPGPALPPLGPSSWGRTAAPCVSTHTGLLLLQLHATAAVEAWTTAGPSLLSLPLQ